MRHSAIVRVTHWLTVLCFLALLISGAEIVVSHPRFYWGETGNIMTPALFQLPVPASRDTVPTAYDYVLEDQNGWSRALHFQTAWILAFTGLLYLTKLRLMKNASYNQIQRATYAVVVFVLFPLVMWTGLAMSPAFDSVFPFTVTLLGGQQSARTIHFFVSIALVLFFFVHVTMICLNGFKSRMRGMISGAWHE